jgi:glycerate kinase
VTTSGTPRTVLVGTSRTVLVAAEVFGDRLGADLAARAIGRGLRAEDPAIETDLCAIEGPREALPRDFDTRMRGAHAVVIAAARLDHETLLRSDAAAEIATRARQAGVPCCAVTGRDGLDLFEARILDLQIVLEAGDAHGLERAGRRLASLM